MPQSGSYLIGDNMEYIFNVRTFNDNYHNRVGYKIKSVSDKCDVSLKDVVEVASFGNKVTMKKNQGCCAEKFIEVCFKVRRKFLQNKLSLDLLSY